MSTAELLAMDIENMPFPEDMTSGDPGRKMIKKSYEEMNRDDNLTVFRDILHLRYPTAEEYMEAVRIGILPEAPYSVKELYPGWPAYAQGGRVGLALGGGFADTLAGDIMAEEDEFIQVVDVSQSDINAIRNTLKVPGMGKMSPSEVKSFTPNASHLTNAEVEGIMEGSITEPTGKYETLNDEDPFSIFSPGTWF